MAQKTVEQLSQTSDVALTDLVIVARPPTGPAMSAMVGTLAGVIGGTYLVAANNLSDVPTPATARANLGLGTLALQNAASVNLTGGVIGTDVTFANLPAFTNRIINGDLRIDQRAGFAAKTLTTTLAYGPDRWKGVKGASGACTLQATSGGPTGFPNCILYRVTTGAAPGSADLCLIEQDIEGVMIADALFGQAGTRNVTLSFMAQATVPGTYAVAFRNAAKNRSYVATYPVNSANTWEAKVITVPVDTAGTWAADTTIGLAVSWDVGSGSGATAPSANTWAAGNYTRVAAATQLSSTTGAALSITAVQLEARASASSFERRSLVQEFDLCQRYFESTYDAAVAPGSVTTNGAISEPSTATGVNGNLFYRTRKRVAPTLIFYDYSTGAAGAWRNSSDNTAVTMAAGTNGQSGSSFRATTSGGTTGGAVVIGHLTADADL